MLALVLLGAIVVVGLFALMANALATPSYVDRVDIVNRSPYGVDVDVRYDDDPARTLLGRALPEQETPKHEVVDAGDRWTFTFTRAGVVAGAIEMTRNELERAHWKVVVPDQVEQQLEAAGQLAYPDEGSR